MRVVVQHIESKLYLASDASWVKVQAEAARFNNPVVAISFCIRRAIRSIRLVSNAGLAEEERYVYPFGEDPAIKAEQKQLRSFLASARRLRQERRVLLQRIDMLHPEGKERKEQLPFKRKLVSED